MKRILLFFTLLAVAVLARAAPFVVTDPVPAGVTQCGVFLDATAKTVTPVVQSGTANVCKVDLAGLASGSHTIQITLITANDPIWGSQESAKSSPLAFSKPVSPAPPTGLVLSP